MSELEKVYNKHYILDFHSGENIMSFNQFKSALTEVLKLVEVTDEEIKNKRIEQAKHQRQCRDVGGYFKPMDIDDVAKWSRDLSKTKLEKLIG